MGSEVWKKYESLGRAAERARRKAAESGTAAIGQENNSVDISRETTSKIHNETSVPISVYSNQNTTPKSPSDAARAKSPLDLSNNRFLRRRNSSIRRGQGVSLPSYVEPSSTNPETEIPVESEKNESKSNFVEATVYSHPALDAAGAQAPFHPTSPVISRAANEWGFQSEYESPMKQYPTVSANTSFSPALNPAASSDFQNPPIFASRMQLNEAVGKVSDIDMGIYKMDAYGQGVGNAAAFPPHNRRFSNVTTDTYGASLTQADAIAKTTPSFWGHQESSFPDVIRQNPSGAEPSQYPVFPNADGSKLPARRYSISDFFAANPTNPANPSSMFGAAQNDHGSAMAYANNEPSGKDSVSSASVKYISPADVAHARFNTHTAASRARSKARLMEKARRELEEQQQQEEEKRLKAIVVRPHRASYATPPTSLEHELRKEVEMELKQENRRLSISDFRKQPTSVSRVNGNQPMVASPHPAPISWRMPEPSTADTSLHSSHIRAPKLPNARMSNGSLVLNASHSPGSMQEYQIAASNAASMVLNKRNATPSGRFQTEKGTFSVTQAPNLNVSQIPRRGLSQQSTSSTASRNSSRSLPPSYLTPMERTDLVTQQATVQRVRSPGSRWKYRKSRMDDYHRSIGIPVPSSSLQSFQYPNGYEKPGWRESAIGDTPKYTGTQIMGQRSRVRFEDKSPLEHNRMDQSAYEPVGSYENASPRLVRKFIQASQEKNPSVGYVRANSDQSALVKSATKPSSSTADVSEDELDTSMVEALGLPSPEKPVPLESDKSNNVLVRSSSVVKNKPNEAPNPELIASIVSNVLTNLGYSTAGTASISNSTVSSSKPNEMDTDKKKSDDVTVDLDESLNSSDNVMNISSMSPQRTKVIRVTTAPNSPSSLLIDHITTIESMLEKTTREKEELALKLRMSQGPATAGSAQFLSHASHSTSAAQASTSLLLSPAYGAAQPAAEDITLSVLKSPSTITTSLQSLSNVARSVTLGLSRSRSHSTSSYGSQKLGSNGIDGRIEKLHDRTIELLQPAKDTFVDAIFGTLDSKDQDTTRFAKSMVSDARSKSYAMSGSFPHDSQSQWTAPRDLHASAHSSMMVNPTSDTHQLSQTVSSFLSKSQYNPGISMFQDNKTTHEHHYPPFSLDHTQSSSATGAGASTGEMYSTHGLPPPGAVPEGTVYSTRDAKLHMLSQEGGVQVPFVGTESQYGHPTIYAMRGQVVVPSQQRVGAGVVPVVVDGAMIDPTGVAVSARNVVASSLAVPPPVPRMSLSARLGLDKLNDSMKEIPMRLAVDRMGGYYGAGMGGSFYTEREYVQDRALSAASYNPVPIASNYQVEEVDHGKISSDMRGSFSYPSENMTSNAVGVFRPASIPAVSGSRAQDNVATYLQPQQPHADASQSPNAPAASQILSTPHGVQLHIHFPQPHLQTQPQPQNAQGFSSGPSESYAQGHLSNAVAESRETERQYSNDQIKETNLPASSSQALNPTTTTLTSPQNAPQQQQLALPTSIVTTAGSPTKPNTNELLDSSISSGPAVSLISSRRIVRNVKYFALLPSADETLAQDVSNTAFSVPVSYFSETKTITPLDESILRQVTKTDGGYSSIKDKTNLTRCAFDKVLQASNTHLEISNALLNQFYSLGHSENEIASLFFYAPGAPAQALRSLTKALFHAKEAPSKDSTLFATLLSQILNTLDKDKSLVVAASAACSETQQLQDILLLSAKQSNPKPITIVPATIQSNNTFKPAFIHGSLGVALRSASECARLSELLYKKIESGLDASKWSGVLVAVTVSGDGERKTLYLWLSPLSLRKGMAHFISPTIVHSSMRDLSENGHNLLFNRNSCNITSVVML